MAGKIPVEWFERRPRPRSVLDGLDEVVTEEDQQKVVIWIQRQIERYPPNDYLITSRPYGYFANPWNKADVLSVGWPFNRRAKETAGLTGVHSTCTVHCDFF
jgi:hypothetical protein